MHKLLTNIRIQQKRLEIDNLHHLRELASHGKSGRHIRGDFRKAKTLIISIEADRLGEWAKHLTQFMSFFQDSRKELWSELESLEIDVFDDHGACPSNIEKALKITFLPNLKSFTTSTISHSVIVDIVNNCNKLLKLSIGPCRFHENGYCPILAVHRRGALVVVRAPRRCIRYIVQATLAATATSTSCTLCEDPNNVPDIRLVLQPSGSFAYITALHLHINLDDRYVLAILAGGSMPSLTRLNLDVCMELVSYVLLSSHFTLWLTYIA